MFTRACLYVLKEGQAVMVGSLEAFQLNFDRTHANVLGCLNEVLLEESVVFPDGLVLHALMVQTRLRPTDWCPSMDDVDMFLFPNSPANIICISTLATASISVPDSFLILSIITNNYMFSISVSNNYYLSFINYISVSHYMSFNNYLSLAIFSFVIHEVTLGWEECSTRAHTPHVDPFTMDQRVL